MFHQFFFIEFFNILGFNLPCVKLAETSPKIVIFHLPLKNLVDQLS